MLHHSRTRIGSWGAAIACIVLASVCALAQSGGGIYVNSNQVNNEVWSYSRAADGTLTFAGKYSTQGNGTGTSFLESQGAIILSRNGKYLYAVNAVSNDITAFSVQPGAQLTFIGKFPSNGLFPNSLALNGTLMYVINHDSDQITAFQVSSQTGAMRPLANSTRNLSTVGGGGAQVSFSPNGKLLIVTERLASKIDTFTVDASGRATGPQVFTSSGERPLGFEFDDNNHLIVSEVRPSAESSYAVSAAGKLRVITGTLIDFGLAACWVANTHKANFPTQYSYTTNTQSDTVSGYAIASDGSLSLVNPTDGITAQLASGAFPLDEVITRDNNYLYVLEGHLPGVGVFQINSDGSLTELQTTTGLPRSSFGMAGN
jgi:6-phosphogluconolactonase (cycloisomerase 2 family)